MRILIAEDDLTTRTVISGVLTRLGHEVVEAVDGSQAWEAMRQPDAPPLAILDWVMPEMDGPEVMRRVRGLNHQDRPPYLIMLTARSSKADIVTGLEAGADDYLSKPFDVGELRARVEVGRRVIDLRDALATKVDELRQALEEVKTLRGIVPICMYCKQVRDDDGYWNQVEVYVQNHTEAEFSHGICPHCLEEHFPEYMEKALPS